MKEAKDLLRIQKAQVKFLLLRQSILTGPTCMIDQLKIYMGSQTSKESTKSGHIIINIYNKKRRKRDRKSKNNNKQEGNRTVIHSVIPLELVKDSLTISFRVHHSLWVSVLKLGKVQFSVTLRDLGIHSIKIESLMKINSQETISDPLVSVQFLKIMPSQVCLPSLVSTLTILRLISRRISVLMVLSTKIF